jgi:hypothetical protein
VLMLAFRAALVTDVAQGYVSCQEAMLAMADRPYMRTYEQQQALQRQAEITCHVSQVKTKLAQAALAPSTVRD